MAKPGERGFKRVASAARYSWSGLKACWRMEAAFRQELTACVLFVPAALLLGQGGAEKAILLSVCFIVLIVEILNSSIEAVVDRIGSEHHDLSGLAKDLGSAAVFVSLGLFLSVWTLVLWF